jgi:hypothetical protein
MVPPQPWPAEGGGAGAPQHCAVLCTSFWGVPGGRCDKNSIHRSLSATRVGRPGRIRAVAVSSDLHAGRVVFRH